MMAVIVLNNCILAAVITVKTPGICIPLIVFCIAGFVVLDQYIVTIKWEECIPCLLYAAIGEKVFLN